MISVIFSETKIQIKDFIFCEDFTNDVIEKTCLKVCLTLDGDGDFD